MIEPVRTSRSGIGARTGTNTKSLGQYSVAFGYGTKASGSYSTASGYNSTASGSYSTASGNYSTASGQSSTASGNSSTASGSYSTASGQSSTASGSYSTASGYNSTASGSYSTASGSYSTASGYNSTASGQSSTASGSYSTASGSYSTAIRYGQRSHSAGQFANQGDAQWAGHVLRVSTADATPTELALDGLSAYLTLAAVRTMACMIRIAAHRIDVSGTAATWPSIAVGITRDATGNCRLLGSVTGAGTTTMCDAGASTWTIAVTAPAANRLAITVTGEAAKTIRWVATVDMAEVG